MKGMDIFCASPSSTAICSSMDHRSAVRNATRPINRYNHLHDKQKALPRVPCSSEMPSFPRPSYEKRRKSSAKHSDLRRKSSADITDLTRPRDHSSRYLLSDSDFVDWFDDSKPNYALVRSQSAKTIEPFPSLVRVHSTKSTHLSSTDSQPAKRTETFSSLIRAESAKSKQQSSNGSHSAKTSEPFVALVPAQSAKDRQLGSNDSHPALKSSSSARSREQVVVLRVSIHCKGCEGKLRKHISKMEGVTSFSTDLASKKVIIKGNVTPLGVLASVSKVKNAQLWQSSTS